MEGDPNKSKMTHIVNVDPCGVIRMLQAIPFVTLAAAVVVNTFTDGISNVVSSLSLALQ